MNKSILMQQVSGTEERNKLIVWLVKRGIPPVKVAGIFHVKRQRIHQILKRARRVTMVSKMPTMANGVGKDKEVM